MLAVALFSVFFVLNVHDIPKYSIFYIILIIAACFIVPLILEYPSKRRFYNKLSQTDDGLEEKYLLSEMIERPDFIEGKILYDVLKSSNKSMNDEIAKYRISTEDYRDYIEKWIHDIKTPIAACKLIAENHPEYSSGISENLEKIDKYVMQTLFYSRISNVEKDYIIKPFSLNELTSSAVRSNSRRLIAAGFKIRQQNLDVQVYTDEKWIGFILDQIISNCISYRSAEPVLSFTAKRYKNAVALEITDNGIGIAECDLPRIFEKNFTGGNGRLNKKSTGFGLYLCKKLCTRLDIDISAKSEENSFTSIIITFPVI